MAQPPPVEPYPAGRAADATASASIPTTTTPNASTKTMTLTLCFGPNKESFALTLPYVQDTAGHRRRPPAAGGGAFPPSASVLPSGLRKPTWWEWKEAGMKSAVVTSKFKSSATLTPSHFALKTDKVFVAPASLRDHEPAEEVEREETVWLVYMPRLKICTFDRLSIEVPCHGHWLFARDVKPSTSSSVAQAPAKYTGVAANDVLLSESRLEDLASLMHRVALFMKNDLEQPTESFIVSVPFGQWAATADGDSVSGQCLHARVQLTDPRLLWTLILRFEELLLDEDEASAAYRLEYIAHQRTLWSAVRMTDYQRWAEADTQTVLRTISSSTGPMHPATFRLPRVFAWNEYGMMQLTLKMPQPIFNMTGSMGAVAPELKGIVRSIQQFIQLAASESVSPVPTFYVFSQGNTCTVLLSVDRYMDVVTRAGGDSITWGKGLLENLKACPDRVYQMIFTEASVLATCSTEELRRIDEALKALDAVKVPGAAKTIPTTVVDLTSLPLSPDALGRVTGRHRTEKRLAAEVRLPSSSASLSAFGTPSKSASSDGPWKRREAGSTPTALPPPPRLFNKTPLAAAAPSSGSAFGHKTASGSSGGSKLDREDRAYLGATSTTPSSSSSSAHHASPRGGEGFPRGRGSGQRAGGRSGTRASASPAAASTPSSSSTTPQARRERPPAQALASPWRRSGAAAQPSEEDAKFCN